jgi:hypothetical protein
MGLQSNIPSRMVRRFSQSLNPVFLIAIAGIAVVCGGETVRTDAPPQRAVVKNQGYLPFADEPINYRSSDLDDPIARLEKRLERGEVSLNYEPRHGYLRSVLDILHIPVSSQTLVFAKTSFQFPQISPATPRALYYDDDVYVGQVHQGKFLEFISFDPKQGAIFYVMDERRSERPRFERAAVDCVQCHVASSTRGVPGVMLRSVFAKPSGYPAGGARSFITGQESPLGQRWGGWYVTAAHTSDIGMANATVSGSQDPEHLEKPAVPNLTSLEGSFNTASYLTGSSDIVALMVLAHQTQMHNLITQTSYQTRLALFAEQQRNTAAGLPLDTISDAARQQFEEPAEKLVRYLLFANEVKLDGAVAGNTSFTQDFAARGPFDSQGRSLRQFDLDRRIFKYPCSYLIYSETFDAIPQPAKEYIYRRLFEVLSGRDPSPEFSSLSQDDRRAILEILVETKSNLPPEWRQFVKQAKQSSTKRASARPLNRQP